MKKLGIFGGTFNPVHNGHLSLCGQLADALKIPRVLLIPTAIPPHKQAKELADEKHRLAMCRLAAQADERFMVSDLELRRRGSSYTVETLRQLEGLYPGTRFFLFLGTDMFLTVQNWYCAEEIFKRAFLAAGARHEGDGRLMKEHLARLKALGAEGEVIPCRVREISSTQVRAARKTGGSLEGLVPPAVEEYIKREGLYLPKGDSEDADG